ncbi:MAG: hypothetical protein AAF193_10150, partial [Bacteroidota bacterium]
MKFKGFSTPKSLLFIGIIALASCGGSDDPQETKTPEEPVIEVNNDNAVGGSVVKMDGEIFSIPSPVQTAILFKKLKVPYHSDILNSLDNAPTYTTRFQKALNLGVYGADLAYLSNYEDN